jgi:hypothetical protein
MKVGFPALITLVLALHASIGCGVVQAAAVIKAPCCGNNCPLGSLTGETSCCPTQNSGAAVQEVSKASTRPVPPLLGFMRVFVTSAMRAANRQAFQFQASQFQDSPPGAAKLALLCSRQI